MSGSFMLIGRFALQPALVCNEAFVTMNFHFHELIVKVKLVTAVVKTISCRIPYQHKLFLGILPSSRVCGEGAISVAGRGPDCGQHNH